MIVSRVPLLAADLLRKLFIASTIGLCWSALAGAQAQKFGPSRLSALESPEASTPIVAALQQSGTASASSDQVEQRAIRLSSAPDDAWDLPGVESPLPIHSAPTFTLSAVRFRGNSVISDSELQGIAAPFTGREIRFDDLVELRDTVTMFYVSNGYATSGAILPQSIGGDRVAEIEIVEGKLGEVQVSGANRLSDNYVARRIGTGEDVVNLNSLEAQLQALQQDPLIERVDAQLMPGSRRDLARLNLEVVEGRPWGAAFGVNNYQSPVIGSERVSASFWHRNVGGGGDSFRADLGWSEGLYEIQASYEVPVSRRDTRVGIRVVSSRSEAVERPFDTLDIESETDTYALDISHPLASGYNNRLIMFGSIEHRRSKSFLLGEGFQFSRGLEVDGVARVFVGRLGLQFTHRDQRQVFAARSTVSIGSKEFDATITDTEPDGEFVSILAQLQWARRFDFLDSRMIVRVDGQWSNDPLLPLEQFAIGGRSTVRGYRENRFVRDLGVIGGVEFRVPLWRSSVGASALELAPFYDIGHSRNKERFTPDEDVLESVGLGLLMSFGDRVSAEIYWADALRDVPDISDEENIQDDGIHFSIRGAF